MADKIRIDSKFDIQGDYELSDPDNDYTKEEKQILANVRKRKHQDSDSEEEVYGFSESEDEDDRHVDMADSDVEGQEQSDDDLPDPKAWGKDKRTFYSTDYVDDDFGRFGDKEEVANMEEDETKMIHKRIIEQMGACNDELLFGIVKDKDTGKKETDFGQMSKRKKLVEIEGTEFTGLIDDFKSKLTVVKDDLQPVLELVKEGKLTDCPASKFVKTNYKLILNYCTNISFYLLLKSRNVNIDNHPITRRLYQYKQMLEKMEPIYMEVVKPQVDKILEAIKNNVNIEIITQNEEDKKYKSKTQVKKLKLLNSVQKEDDDTGVSDDNDNEEMDYDDEGISTDFFKTVSSNKNVTKSESEESGFSDNEDAENDINKPSTSSEIITDVGDKREITYQIAKNKGLTPYRKKEQRNPRVKHKLKYRKAKIRRKGAVREPRTEVTRYGGEPSGIKSNVKKGIKIK